MTANFFFDLVTVVPFRLTEMHRYLDRKGILGEDGGTEGRVQVLGMMGQKT